jgi:uncharacterized protein YdaU (DUF1376 family)
MHYYKRNLGDYAKKAGRLTMLQHGAYTLLIDSCYDREVFPTLEQAIEWTWASTEAEVDAVKFVLSRFFNLTKDGQYVQDRILQELLEYHAKADKNKEIAIEREAKRKEFKTERTRNVNESSPNHKPITNNHEPLTNNHKPSTGEVCLAIKENGIIDVNPSNPTLIKLIEAGATVNNFADAAKVCNVKKFAYLLKVIESDLEKASNLNVKSGVIVSKQQKRDEDLQWFLGNQPTIEKDITHG